MKKLALLALFVGSVAYGQTKKVTSAHVEWWGYKVAKSEATSHNGTVDVKSGSVKMKNKQIVGGTFVLDMNTINATDVTGDKQAKLNDHLKNGDFFEVEKYPIATFTIKEVKNNPNDKVFNKLVHGNLTVKGKTHPIVIPAKITVDRKGVLTLESKQFSFDRQKFDVTYASSMKDVMVKDDVDMKVKFSAKYS